MLAAVALGVLVGAVAGLVPGIHSNLVALLVVDRFSGAAAVPLIVAIATTNLILDFIPSILLGIPEESTALSVLPAHRLALEGRASQAFFLAMAGAFGALLLSIALIPAFFVAVPAINERRWLMPLLVVGTLAALVLTERNRRGAVAVLALATVLGYASSDVPDALLPMLSGLFGASTILLSLADEGSMPPQDTDGGSCVGWRDLATGTVVGTVSGAVVGFVPGVGSSQACLLSSLALGGNDRTVLVSMGAVNTANFVFNMVTLSLTGKVRSGIAAAVRTAAGGADVFAPSIIAMALSASIVVVLAMHLFRLFLRVMGRVDYRTLSLLVLSFNVLIVAVRCGPAGLALLAASTALGVVPPTIGVRRSLCMGCLMVPVAVFLVGTWMGF